MRRRNKILEVCEERTQRVSGEEKGCKEGCMKNEKRDCKRKVFLSKYKGNK